MNINKAMYDEVRLLLIHAVMSDYNVSENTKKLAFLFDITEDTFEAIELLKKRNN